jgi:hypothetical protein
MAKKKDEDFELDPSVTGAEPAAEEMVSVSSIDRLTAAIEKMATLQMMMLEKGQQPSSENVAIMSALTEALERVSQNQMKGAEVVAQSYRQVHRPSNEVAHLRNVFHPRGNPLLLTDYEQPKLKCSCWVPRPEEPSDNMLTREETELLNILTECPGVYVITRIDDTKIKLAVKVDYGVDEVTPSRLVLQHDTAFNNEYFRLLPPLHSQLRQVFAQHSNPDIRRRAAEVLTMDEEMTLIKAGKLSVAA